MRNESRPTVLLHTDTLKLICKLPMKSRGEVVTAMLAVALGGELPGGEQPPKLDTCADIIFTVIQDQLNREYSKYLDRCSKRQEAICKRWADAKYPNDPAKAEEYMALRLEELRRKMEPSKARAGMERDPNAPDAFTPPVVDYFSDDDV